MNNKSKCIRFAFIIVFVFMLIELMGIGYFVFATDIRSSVSERFAARVEKTEIFLKSSGPTFELTGKDVLSFHIKAQPDVEIHFSVYGYTPSEKTLCFQETYKASANDGFLIKNIAVSQLAGGKCQEGYNMFFAGNVDVKHASNTIDVKHAPNTTGVAGRLFDLMFPRADKPVAKKFYFGTKRTQAGNHNALLIVPTTNFYNYYSATGINNYFNSDRGPEDYFVGYFNEVPVESGEELAEKLFTSSQNMASLGLRFRVINDYEINKEILEKYNLILFPFHQEYIIEQHMNLLIDMLNASTNFKTVISVGAANFLRYADIAKDDQGHPVGFKYNLTRIAPLEKYGLSKFRADLFYSGVCKYDANKGDIVFNDLYGIGMVGEMSSGDAHVNKQDYFFDITCKDETIPLMSVTKFPSGKVIHFNTDGAGLYFKAHKKLNEKFRNELNLH